jgi:predicted CXXCH cytochrome family protein
MWRGAALGSLLLVVPALFLGALAQKERDNRFCISCHLHEEKFTRFLAPVSRDLAGVHHAKKAVRCIDCHGGADPAMRARVWAVAGVDTLRFLAGRYGEPDRMRLPLRDAECSQCHAPIVKKTLPSTSYHVIRDHETVPVACVQCHTSHTADGEARFQFLARPRVLPICRECHKNL